MDFPNKDENKSGEHSEEEHVCDDGCGRADNLVQQALALSEGILNQADKRAIQGLLTGKALHPDELAMLGCCQSLAKLADRAGLSGALQDTTKKGTAGVRAQVDDNLFWLSSLFTQAYRMHNDGKGSVVLKVEYRDA